METVTLSTKGQLVIPARIRGQLLLSPGSRLSIRVEAGAIVLKPEKELAWKPLNPSGASLSASELSRAVSLRRAGGEH